MQGHKLQESLKWSQYVVGLRVVLTSSVRLSLVLPWGKNCKAANLKQSHTTKAPSTSMS